MSSDQKSQETDLLGSISDRIVAEIDKIASSSGVSDRTRTRIRKFARDLFAERTKQTGVKGALDLLAIFLSTPLGQWLLTVILLEMLAKAKFFSQISVDILIGVVTSSEVIRAIGSSGLLPEIAGLAGLFG
ncbi:MAG: hypothetical protein QW429_03865 [Thermoprotei archaeon]